MGGYPYRWGTGGFFEVGAQMTDPLNLCFTSFQESQTKGFELNLSFKHFVANLDLIACNKSI